MTKKRNGNQFLKESELQYLEQFCKPFDVIYIQKLQTNSEDNNVGYLEIIVESKVGDDAESIKLPRFKLQGKGSKFKGIGLNELYTPGALGIK